MRIKVKKEAVNANCDQWAEIISVKANRIWIKLLGTDERAQILAHQICGIHIHPGLTVEFQTTRISHVTKTKM